MVDVYKILQCPLCQRSISESLECAICGEQYVFKNDVHVMVNRKLSKREWKWDEKRFTDETQKVSRERYDSYLNEDTRKATDAWSEAMGKHMVIPKDSGPKTELF